MNNLIRHSLGIALLTGLITLNVCADSPDPGYVDFGKFTPPASGGEFVEVNINGSLISMVARLAEKAEPEIAELVRGLHGIRVNVIGLNNENREEITKRVKDIRAELEAKQWQRIVTVMQKDEDIGVYVKTRGEEAVEGVAVTIIEGKGEAVLVNVIGNLKPEKIALIGERFHIEPLKKVGAALEKEKK